MTSIMEVSKADSGVRNRHSHQKVSGARSPRHVTGLGRVEWGRKLGQGPLGAITVAEGRDAESWLGITAGRIDMRFHSDIKSTGFRGWRRPRRSTYRSLWRGLGKWYPQPLIFILMTITLMNEAGE